MGLLDNVKAKLGPAKDKVSDLAQRHEDKIHHGLDKAAEAVDKSTKGKYSDRIQSGTGKAKGAMGRLAHKEDGTPGTGGTASATGTTSTPGTPPGPSAGATPADAGGTAPPRDTGGTTPPDDVPPPTS
ncbi:antitoxin [Streptomyces sp. NPDC017943]|uniref:antitoxin n=1 Tax=Streptomyces sp. NPDC017943 TaxID=3365019 RepID=UPI00379E6107